MDMCNSTLTSLKQASGKKGNDTKITEAERLKNIRYSFDTSELVPIKDVNPEMAYDKFYGTSDEAKQLRQKYSEEAISYAFYAYAEGYNYEVFLNNKLSKKVRDNILCALRLGLDISKSKGKYGNLGDKVKGTRLTPNKSIGILPEYRNLNLSDMELAAISQGFTRGIDVYDIGKSYANKIESPRRRAVFYRELIRRYESRLKNISEYPNAEPYWMLIGSPMDACYISVLIENDIDISNFLWDKSTDYLGCYALGTLMGGGNELIEYYLNTIEEKATHVLFQAWYWDGIDLTGYPYPEKNKKEYYTALYDIHKLCPHLVQYIGDFTKFATDSKDISVAIRRGVDLTNYFKYRDRLKLSLASINTTYYEDRVDILDFAIDIGVKFDPYVAAKFIQIGVDPFGLLLKQGEELNIFNTAGLILKCKEDSVLLESLNRDSEKRRKEVLTYKEI